MIEIRTKGEALDLPSGFSIEIEDSSPIFNDRGSQSVPATVPATRRNIRLLDAPHRIDTGVNPNNPERSADLLAGAYLRRGVMNVTEASRQEGIVFNIGFDNATAYARWRERRLADVAGSRIFIPPGGAGVDSLLHYFDDVYGGCDERECEFAVFTVAVDKTERDSAGDGSYQVIYWDILNLPEKQGLHQFHTVRRVVNSEVTDVSVPWGYGVTPFLRVWRVLELVFEDLGVKIEGNPFKEEKELARLVVLNNAADAICRGTVRISDLMPDCTVEEFLNSLWVRFGLVYDIDARKRSVRLRLLKDILTETGGEVALTEYICGREKIIYNTAQYIKLSAGTSLEGAAPASERFEDFSRGLEITELPYGESVDKWKPSTGSDRDWNGNLREDYDAWDDYDPDRDGWDQEWDREDWTDPDEDRWDDREHREELPDDGQDDGRDDSPSGPWDAPGLMSIARSGSGSASTLARELITGMWYKLDSKNGKVRESSSGNFCWDPAPEGLEALELSSSDECVPVRRITTAGTGLEFAGYVPVYLTGSRHYHTYIAENDDAEESVETPLAFMFAYCMGGKTIGRVSPEGEDGLPVKLDDGSRPRLSLFFQFRDGLFAQFWRRYDEILRHGNRTVEIETRIPRYKLKDIIDFLGVRTLGNVRCLIDSANYSLPSGKETAVNMKLRTIQTHGVYDIDVEQDIPAISAAMYHLEWRIASDKFSRNLDTFETKLAAIARFKEQTGYANHGKPGEWWSVDWQCAAVTNMIRLEPTWRTDRTLPEPYIGGSLLRSYRARIYYDIRERYDPTPPGSDRDDSYVTDEVIGKVWVDVDYEVTLRCAKIAD